MDERETYAGLIEVASEALFALDPQGVVLAWNRGAEHLYGFAAAEAIGRRLGELIVLPEDQRALVGWLEEVKRGPLAVQTTRHTAQGDRRHVAMSMRWMTTDSGMGYVAVSATDRTQDTELEEVRRVKSEFLANMSHELRTPLNSIIGFAELMHKGKVGPMAPEHIDFLGDIVTSARRLLGLVNDVLDLARFDAGAIAFDPVAIDVGQVVKELREVLRGALAAKQLKLVDEISTGCERVNADPARLKQVLYAFVERAAKVTPALGKIIVRCGPAPTPTEIQLEVQAGGASLSDSELRKVFLEFQERNAGLGLALARRIVEAHGGRVDAKTDASGSTLVAILPR
ncbi:MAG: histidine kinase dimerization/phospho-acceptor domain-containing protein [Kofleriaceae bacterium]